MLTKSHHITFFCLIKLYQEISSILRIPEGSVALDCEGICHHLARIEASRCAQLHNASFLGQARTVNKQLGTERNQTFSSMLTTYW